jgi:hypothetical protein
MTKVNRREFLVNSTAAVGTLASGGPTASAQQAAATVELSWLDGAPPRLPSGVAFGVPWPRGAVTKKAQVFLHDGAGKSVAVQTWPLAYWPDGSIKWTGLAIAADAASSGLRVSSGKKAGQKPTRAVTLREDAQSVVIETGAVTARLEKSGPNLVSSLTVSGREVARDGRLVAVREDRSSLEAEGVRQDVPYESDVTSVTIEQSGPVRAVIRLEGVYSSQNGIERKWLPFTVRLYFTAGLSDIRMVHSFIFDGDQATDFIKGVGLQFTVPFREEIQNRHVRFATDNHNVFSEPVLMAPGYNPRTMHNAVEFQTAQLKGERIPNLDDIPASDKANILETPTWDSFKFNQLTADSWEITKRTNPKSSWQRITGGHRGRGLAFLGDVSGGLGVSLKRFWQKCPSGFEITAASRDAGMLKTWFWAPDAQPMDLRHYDTKGHALNVVYEDYEEGHATPYGCANTSELTLWATPETPSAETLDAMADLGSNPPLLICPPQHYYDCQTLGYWSLPATSVPGLTAADIASADIQLDRAFEFYKGEIDRRRWYGFWDFGDFKRTYDPIRSQWMYDIGGHGWNATELMPNMWLWFAFLRSGRADIFRMAEDMTRNTLEVDVYHLGKFAGLGSRHNVTHWGCGAKEARINVAHLKRFYYYLTTDERTGDLMREPLKIVEASLATTPPLRKVVPRPDVFAPKSFIRIGPDWLSLASHWLGEWERTGDTRYRDYCLTGMRDIGAMPDILVNDDGFEFDPATKHLKSAGQPNVKPGQFLFLFAGDQIAYEFTDLIDCPEFRKAWEHLCERFIAERRVNWYYEPRVTALAANTTGNKNLHTRAIALYRGLLHGKGHEFISATPELIDGPRVTQPSVYHASAKIIRPVNFATTEVAQWGINLITMPEILRRFEVGDATN